MNFGCAVNCIDGRAQVPVIEWLKMHGNVQYVDVVSEPGMDALLSGKIDGDFERIHEHVFVSVSRHNASIIAVVGHFDCAVNPVSNEEHYDQVRDSVDTVSRWFPAVRIVGLFVNEFETVDIVVDHSIENAIIRSFL